MSDTNWETCSDPVVMLDMLRGRVSNRELRLFACACCRRVWGLLLDDRSKNAVIVSERFAEGLVSAEEMNAALQAHEAAEAELTELGDESDIRPCHWAAMAAVTSCALGGVDKKWFVKDAVEEAANASAWVATAVWTSIVPPSSSRIAVDEVEPAGAEYRAKELREHVSILRCIIEKE